MIENINFLANQNVNNDKSADQGGAGDSISSPMRANAERRENNFGNHQMTENHNQDSMTSIIAKE